MADNTRYLMHFPAYALKESARLLTAYCDPSRNLAERLQWPLSLEWNPTSTMTFLIGADFSVGVIDADGYLRDWWTCPCGGEGFAEAMLDGNQCCANLIRESQRRSA
jgi:hypothetical protein